jgi:hypothetical protein
MSFDIDAILFVGLPLNRLKLKQLPLYDEYLDWVNQYPDGGHYPSFYELVNEFYYIREVDLKYVEMYEEPNNSQALVGFVIAETPYWMPEKLVFAKLSTKYHEAFAEFTDLVGLVPNLYLLPRMNT